MALDSQIAEQLNQTISIKALSSRDRAGTPTYAAASTADARVEFHRENIELADGTKLVTSHRILTASAVTYTDRIWLPGDSSATATLARIPRRIEVGVSEAGGSDYYVIVI